ncbi:MAG TPA: response regulator transcription factor [Capsulimonadaceae bacterium]|nr:response regulator transcription factor [Capsulimonadaceae bacterium]
MIRIIIVAAYATARADLQNLLEGQPEIAVVGTASGASELARHLAEGPVDAVLLEESDGDLTDVLGVLAPAHTPLVVLGDRAHAIEEVAHADLPGWASLLREAEAGEVAAALGAVAAGLVVVDRSLVASLAPATSTAPLTNGGETLTGREREVLQLMAQGLANKQIGARLSISLHTVKFHVASILAKLGASSRTEAVTLGARQGHVVL